MDRSLSLDMQRGLDVSRRKKISKFQKKKVDWELFASLIT